jgi:16S rRNA (guanine(966)-N(2))-methyltransferase RsmD
MRILAGLYKGRNLQTVPDFSVRPATGRVRQTLFDMLTHRVDFDGLHVLDLFAGFGSLGFEALSRGASHVTFVDMSPDALKMIEANAKALKCLESVEILRGDAVDFATSSHDTYGLIFADPPYAYARTNEIPHLILSSDRLAADGYLLIEHSSDREFESNGVVLAGPVKHFGRTTVTFFQHPPRQS